MSEIDWSKLTDQEIEQMIALYRGEIAIVMGLPLGAFVRLPAVDRYLAACEGLRAARKELARRYTEDDDQT